MQRKRKSALLGAGMALSMAAGLTALTARPTLADTPSAHVDRAHQTTETITETYRAFVAAQNARDLDPVGAFFTDGSDFLWVSDGRPVWGREATLARMALFQGAETWRVIPDLDEARVVMLAEEVAMMHFDLILEIGRAAAPSRLPFLVSILFVATTEDAGGWRIASLLTTDDKQLSR